MHFRIIVTVEERTLRAIFVIIRFFWYSQLIIRIGVFLLLLYVIQIRLPLLFLHLIVTSTSKFVLMLLINPFLYPHFLCNNLCLLVYLFLDFLFDLTSIEYPRFKVRGEFLYIDMYLFLQLEFKVIAESLNFPQLILVRKFRVFVRLGHFNFCGSSWL